MKTPSKQVRLGLLCFQEIMNQQSKQLLFFSFPGRQTALPASNLVREPEKVSKQPLWHPKTRLHGYLSRNLWLLWARQRSILVWLCPGTVISYKLSTHCISCHLQVYFLFQNECKYTLYAVVVHSGYAMCGHYTAYVRHRVNQCWYYADDSRVKQVLPIWQNQSDIFYLECLKSCLKFSS